MRHIDFLLPLGVLALVCGCSKREATIPNGELTTIAIGLPETRTHLGPSADGVRKVYWSDGDMVVVNGTASEALSGIGDKAASAVFTFPDILNAPYNVLYPASFYKDESTVTLPSVQTYAAGSFASDTAPLAGCSASGGSAVSLSNLCSVLQLAVLKDASVSASPLSTVVFRGNDGEQVAGDFSLDYENAVLTAAGSGNALTLNVEQSLSESDGLYLYLVVPAGTYADGFSFTLEDDAGRSMVKSKTAETVLAAGKIYKLTSFAFVPSPIASEIGIEDIMEVSMAPDGYNITGSVADSNGNPLEGVVVSDGTYCVRTQSDGKFYLTSDDPSDVDFVFVSTPSGYLPPVSGGIPQFYKTPSSATLTDGVYDYGSFVMTAVENPDTFTILFTADPQPRISTAALDRVAYHSLDCCNDLYRELSEVAASISGRQVYGICLGDLVHGSSSSNLALMDTYATALGSLGYPTYNIIGNHDYDTSAEDDDSGAEKFESLFGPRNYSFNIGGIHFLMLDNLIMYDGGSGLTSYYQGLSDEIWAWMQRDLAFVDSGSTVMACAHSPMFRLINGSERASQAATRHGADYQSLLSNYAEVHAWAGHTHTSFNYVYGSGFRSHIEVHTLARSTGELWTNEYLAAGTPRGFTIVEVKDGKVASWRFHANKYQTGSFAGSCGQPGYEYRDWAYNSSGIAVMNDTGEVLDESYQMHVYAPGVYEDGYLYVNVFLWDSKWETPVFTPDGEAAVVMEAVSPDVSYDYGDFEVKNFYSVNYPAMPDEYDAAATGAPVTLFKAAAGSSGSGTVSVTDRFGTTYTRSISW